MGGGRLQEQQFRGGLRRRRRRKIRRVLRHHRRVAEAYQSGQGGQRQGHYHQRHFDSGGHAVSRKLKPFAQALSQVREEKGGVQVGCCPRRQLEVPVPHTFWPRLARSV